MRVDSLLYVICKLMITWVAATVFFTLLAPDITGAQIRDKDSASRVVEGKPQRIQPPLTVRVTDPTGARIPNAKVTVWNVANQVEAEGQTDSIGEFQPTGISPGSYSLRIVASGFKSEKRSIVVNPDITSGISLIFLQLEFGATSDPQIICNNLPAAEPMPNQQAAIPDSLPLASTVSFPHKKNVFARVLAKLHPH
jgi:Carboxypeptidase regulatory-like domain